MVTPITPNKVGNKDLHITNTEWNDWEAQAKRDGLNDNTMVTYYGKQIKWGLLKQMKNTMVDPGTPADPKGTGTKAIEAQGKIADHLHTVLEKITDKIEELQAKLQTAAVKNSKTKTAEITKKLASLNKRKAQLVDKQRQNLSKFVNMHKAKPPKTGKAKWWAMLSQTPPKGVPVQKSKGGGVSASMTGGKAATANAPQQQKAAGNAKQAGGKAATTSKGGGWGPASGWGGKAMGGPSFSAGAYAKSLFMEDNIMKSWDGINKSQNRGKQLMQLLFYYMRMAMSGDLTAMYNMMKAVLYIISKDKALQQTHMAGKLIKLQDDSRRQTDKLLNFNADQKDPNSQMQFTKLLQEVKSESDSVATSQKLIAQMMEEMAQIVETLTNVTKGALDASGRVLRTVSRFT